MEHELVEGAALVAAIGVEEDYRVVGTGGRVRGRLARTMTCGRAADLNASGRSAM